ncbi:uncharacterized protein LOC122505115 [Leptopilina heterotoma]|uniref:uncharacterized protein LOC122505115 n=1 Tax=Leptopilina heterotoma TaxID=63436 RepID=UPI001CA832F8|nr:uncharacterized protein LOC122505115 [Leptopilina heterotoma]
MPTNCVINNCNSGSREQIKSQVYRSFFSPQTDEILRIWSDAVASYTTKPLTKNKKICDLHFRDEDIERDFVTKLKDGTIHRIPRKKPLLKPHAVPVFFPNISIQLLKSQQISYGWKDLLLECNGSENQKYHIIKKHCDLVPLPSKLWTVYNCAENFIAWIGICEDEAHTTKRVILLPDMRVQVSFLDFIIGEKEVQVPREAISNVDEIPKLLEVTSKLLPCQTECTERSKKCMG